MSHVVLIYPPQVGLTDPASYPPLGLLYVAASIRQTEHTVEIANMAAGWTGGIESLPEADYYGVSVAQATWQPVLDIIEGLQQHRTGSQIIVGGALAVAEPERVLRETAAHYVVNGEGEEAIKRILQGRCKQGILDAPRIRALDTLPFPARYLLPREQVFSANGIHKVPGLATTLITSRGCPYTCAFCSKIRIMQGKPVLHSGRYVANEMAHLKKEYGCTSFRVIDDIFNADPERTRDLCRRITGKGYHILAASRADHLQELDELRMLRAAGVEHLGIGVESADPGILATIHKGESVDEMVTAFWNCRITGIRTHALLIYGLPGESLESIERTKRFMEQAQPDTYMLSTFTPLPGSPIWKHPERYGVSIDKQKYSGWFYHDPGDRSDIPEYLAEEVQAARGPLQEWLKSGVWRQ